MQSPVKNVSEVFVYQARMLARVNRRSGHVSNAIVADAFAQALRNEHRVRAFLEGLVDESAFCPPRDASLPVVESVAQL